MTAVSVVTLRLGPGNPPTIIAERGDGVPDVFWGQLRVEWGYDGDPGQAVHVPLSRFRGNLGWLKPACAAYRVKLEWDPRVREIISQIGSDRRQLDSVMASNSALTEDEVRARLAESRFRRDLKPFQLRDVSRLLALPHGANFSVPGAGKTTVAYAVYEAERAAGRISRMLVVAPLSAFDAWKSEAEECFAPGERPRIEIYNEYASSDVEVLLVNYHRLASNYDELATWVSKVPTLVLLDEAHRIKAGRSGTHGSACLDLAFSADRRDVLTGTPAPQASGDFVALLDFLWPGQARRILPQPALTRRPAPEVTHDVAAAIRPLFVRTRKEELGLTAPNLRIEHVTLEGLHRDIYMALRDRYAGLLAVSMNDRAELSKMGTIVMYLLEAATNPHLLAAGSSDVDPPIFRHPPLPVEPGSRLWDLIQRYNQYETPAKFQQLARLVSRNAEDGRKTLIWSNFVRNLHALHRMFNRYEPALIYGGVPSETSSPTAQLTRESELQRFREDPSCMILLANPAAMSEGVSLHQVCHDAIYLDRTFNAGQYLQSIDRIHRLGLPPRVETNLTFLVTSGTIDDVVDERIRIKATALGNMLNDPDLVTMALPQEDEEGYGYAVDDTQDLQALFAHLRGEP
ncbi:DEAD/DEAH box helicase [Planotetraspora kaengkrachanensis]|uniref:DNA helicase n=1 Tax=Planotetraspora kaengkrachanensis TaxID=575193 RepID=A0A8J3LWJ9_9ACTN|nr:DEAD/DEAH box helicase [Planotetraspora kaengkrachanensis]GIG80007.1 DNA helicase [Planotetraspora kaengkrachanensis]